MKKLFCIAALMMLFVSVSSAQNLVGGHVIGFYNLENLFDTIDDPAHNDEEFLPDGLNRWTEAKYRRKVSNMARVIRAMHDDNGLWHTVLGISEIENRLVIEDLVSDPQIADANYQIVHYDGPDTRGVDVALLYDPARFTYIESESIPYTFDDTKVVINLDEKTRAAFRTRDILMVHGKIDGEDFAIYVCHLPSRLGGKSGALRCRGAEIIYNHARQMERRHRGLKVVVMGDMNDNPTDESQTVWLHGREKIEARMLREDFFNPFIAMQKAGYGSLAYRGKWNIYDIIQVNYNLAAAPFGGLKIQPIVKNRYYGRIFHKPFMIQKSGQYKGQPFRTFSNGAFIGGFSDHFPTYIVIDK